MLKVLLSNRRSFYGFIGLCFFGLMASIGPWITPLDMTVDHENRFLPPSLSHPLGTDHAGRDIAQQIVHGSPGVLIIAFTAASFGLLFAVVIGFLAALKGGMVDLILVRLIDVLLVLPRFPVLVILATLLPVKDSFTFGLVISLFNWPSLARSLRAQVLSLKGIEFVEVTKIMGLGTGHVIFKELVPNMISYITINFIEMARGAITASIGIMFLGLVPLDPTNWGMMLYLSTFTSGAIYVPHAIMYVLSPVLTIVLFQYCMVSFASGLNEVFDPRLRRI